MNELIRQNNQTQLMALHDLESYAKYIVASGMFGIQKPEQAIGLMLLCQAEGLNPIQAVRRYHIIQGKPAMRADAMLAEYQARGGVVQWLERTDTACEAVFHHPASGPVNVRWTIDDARMALLCQKGGMWEKYPRQMLTARVISEGIRTSLPGVVAGIYTPEEVESFDSLPIVATTIDYPALVTAQVVASEVVESPVKPVEMPAEINRLSTDFCRVLQANGIYYLVKNEGKIQKNLMWRLVATLTGTEVVTPPNYPRAEDIQAAIDGVPAYAKQLARQATPEPLKRTTPEPVIVDDPLGS